MNLENSKAANSSSTEDEEDDAPHILLQQKLSLVSQSRSQHSEGTSDLNQVPVEPLQAPLPDPIPEDLHLHLQSVSPDEGRVLQEALGEQSQKIKNVTEENDLEVCTSIMSRLRSQREKLIEAQNSETETLRNQIENLEEKNKLNESEVESLRKKIETALNKIENLEERNKLNENEVKALETDLQESETENERLRDKLNTAIEVTRQADQEIDILRKEAGAEVKKLKMENTELRKENETFKKTVEEYQRTIERLQEEVTQRIQAEEERKKEEETQRIQAEEEREKEEERLRREADRGSDSPEADDIEVVYENLRQTSVASTDGTSSSSEKYVANVFTHSLRKKT